MAPLRTRVVPVVVSSLLACAGSAVAQAQQPAPAEGAAGQARPASDARPTIQPESGGPVSQHVYLDAQTGIESVQLRTFFADFNTVSAGVLPTWGVGPTARVGGGLRFGFLTLGLRGRVAAYDDPATVGPWQIWTLDAEIGVRVPLHRVEPHVVLAAGYSSFGGFGSAVAGLSQGLAVHGGDVRLGAGVDYWVARNVSLGLDLDGELLAIARPGVAIADLATAKQIGTLDDARARVLEASGTSIGAAASLNASVGLHF